MRKVDDGEEKKKKKKGKKKRKRENNGIFSGHYVIASSLQPERLCPNDDRWNAARSCQKLFRNIKFVENLEKYVAKIHFISNSKKKS